MNTNHPDRTRPDPIDSAKQKHHLAVIYGSNREDRLCDSVAQWVLSRVAALGRYEVEIVDPAAMNLPPRLGSEADQALCDYRRSIGWADAYLIVTPEYNHGYPSVLKFLIDSANEEWKRKPAAFVSYGGQSGGLRAVEQLRQVFGELHVVTMRDSVSFVNAWDSFDVAGNLHQPAAANGALASMLEHLDWWATTLGTARRTKAEPAMA